MLDEDPLEGLPPNPRKSLPLFFDFVEVCAGAGKISHYCAQMGMSVCPPLDLDHSLQYDLKSCDVILWLVEMLRVGRLRSVFVSPPCTTFSPAAFPACRTYADPWGFHNVPKVRHGNILALRALALVYTARTYDRAGCAEQPRRSKMAWLRVWRELLQLPGVKEVFLAACQFGSIHKKEFRLVGVNLGLEKLARPCRGGHAHVIVQGRYTKASSVYPDELAREIAIVFGDFIKIDRGRTSDIESGGAGLESPIINDLLAARPWTVERVWKWKRPEHINLLELRGLIALLKSKPASTQDTRLLHLFDSSVALAASTKGRSSSKSIAPLLGQACALQLAAGTYCAEGFAPTRLNVADDPTRNVEIRRPQGASLIRHVHESLVSQLATIRVKRFLANWIRLACLLVFVPTSEAAFVEEGSQLPVTEGLLPDFSSALFDGFRHSGFFSSHLGFFSFSSWASGIVACAVIACLLIMQPTHHACPPRVAPESGTVTPRILKYRVFAVAVALSHGCHAVRPQTVYERKAAERASFLLQGTRAVLPKTDLHRQVRLADFSRWLAENTRIQIGDVTAPTGVAAEEINDLLIQYGQDLYRGGRPYGHFSELINAVASSRPVLRKQLTGAWDLAYNWLSLEPHVHHIALPAIVLLAFLTTCLLWGWTREAGLFALMWGGLCRPGEVVAATRRHLVLPRDVVFGQAFILLRIEEPKTRRRAAKHQSSKVDLPDLVQIIEIAFGSLNPGEKLWPFSGQTLRARFRKVCEALDLQSSGLLKKAQLDLSSFRPGGATWLLQSSDNPELVRRRGRWLNPKVMEIYLQEVQAATFLSDQPWRTREKIAQVASSFPHTLKAAARYRAARLPPSIWYLLFTREDR